MAALTLSARRSARTSSIKVGEPANPQMAWISRTASLIAASCLFEFWWFLDAWSGEHDKLHSSEPSPLKASKRVCAGRHEPGGTTVCSLSLDPPKFFHDMFPPLADPSKRRFGLVLAHFRMVHRNIQFRITDVLDVTFANLLVLNRNALLKKNG